MTMTIRISTRKHLDMRMTMPTQLRQLLRLRRHMTITKRTAMIIHTRTHTHEQPEPECRHRAAHRRGSRH